MILSLYCEYRILNLQLGFFWKMLQHNSGECWKLYFESIFTVSLLIKHAVQVYFGLLLQPGTGFRRQIVTTKVAPRAVRVLVVDP